MLTVGSNVVTPSRSSKPAGEPSLIVTGLAGDTIEGHSPLVDASFAVRAGEIFGIAGVGGNGQTELAAALVGGRLPSAGTIAIKDPARNALIDITTATPRERRDRGVAAVPADRQSFGLASSLSIVDNFAIGFIHERQIRIAGPGSTAPRWCAQPKPRSPNSKCRACAACGNGRRCCPAAMPRS